ncbi:RING-H2 finger protein ATL58-like [Selaginella moellendorffii]|uniref:RING-H2 finger protein ATL58-like n=1 Tax=Selaginella moellendorffii TaxID=88036 RepID=UPI000D1C37E8|nr:RING-H2 finger protein ATL58-like [Selaginella moellendorffii]|eukprot:XP_024521077.1 RING-H2 finger protein ATL58-like [Selaginella moellendorffii]
MISSSMNVVMTVLGFAVSATFIVFVCARLLWRRRRRRGAAAPGFQVASMERSLSGLEPSVVATFPSVKYNQRMFSREDALCTVCLNDYAEKEMLRLLPWCGHAFHIDCIDAWLRQHSTCPICRLSLRSSPDRRLVNYSQMNPQMAPAIRPLFDPELQLSNEMELQSQHPQHPQQQQSVVSQQQGWSSQVFEYEGTGSDHRRLVSSRPMRPGKWSLKLWKRSDRDDEHGGGGDHSAQLFGAPSSQDSSVTININIGQMPPHEVSGANNHDSDATNSNRSDVSSANDVSISLQSPRCANGRDGRHDEQREINVDSSHHSRPVNLSIELNVCDGAILGYSAASRS